MENGGPDPARSDEEEALKRNTDCVYFLASPLTCKKGAECEYRHSEGARVNPRDCWYWLNGHCLNPKCSFRHPPLDGLLGGTATPSAPGLQEEAVSAPQAFPLHASATQTTNKQNIPCYYFRKGMCAKGGMCPYMHGPAPAPTTNNPVPPIAENPLMLKKSTWSLNKCTQENTLRTTNEPLAVPVVSSLKPAAESVKLPNNALTVKTSSVPVQTKVELPSRLQSSSISTGSGNGGGRPESPQDEAPDDFVQNGRESEEFLRESSPGFDVLVDGQTEDSEYYHEGGEYASGNTDYHHSADYATASNLEREPYEGLGDYDQHMEVRDPYGRERHRFPERSLERSSIPERRRSRRDESPVEMESFDLRHQLRKQRKLSHSSFNSNQRRPHRREDYRVDEHVYEPRGSQKDQIPHNDSISKRLQGRINLPSRESGDRPVDMYSRDIKRGRNWGRSSSPGRPTRYQGRLHDRLSLTTHGDFPADLRKTGNLSAARREETGIRQFSGPKSLAELKDSKVSDRSDRFSRFNGGSISDESKTRPGTLIGCEETNPGSFEGPKPLSEILKQKRAAASKSEKVNDKVEGSTSNNNEEHQPLSNQHEHEIEPVEEEEGIIPAGGDEQQQVEASAKDDETENVVIVDDMEGAEYYEGDEEYYYEEVEGEEYKGDDENVYEEHYVEEGKEFAKEDGAMLS